MKYRVLIEPTAEAGIRRAAAWLIRERSTTAAAKWTLGLLKKIKTLETHPHRCPLADENDDFEEEIRVLLYGKKPGVYRVIFTIRGDAVSVLYVRHSARGPIEP